MNITLLGQEAKEEIAWWLEFHAGLGKLQTLGFRVYIGLALTLKP